MLLFLCPCLQPFSVCKLSTGKCSNWLDTYTSSVCDHWCFLLRLPHSGSTHILRTLSECTFVHSLPSRENIFCFSPPDLLPHVGRSYLFFKTQPRNHILVPFLSNVLLFLTSTYLYLPSFFTSGHIASYDYYCSDFYNNDCPSLWTLNFLQEGNAEPHLLCLFNSSTRLHARYIGGT